MAFLQGQMQPVATAGYTVELRQVPLVQLPGISHRGPYMVRPSRRWSPSPWAADSPVFEEYLNNPRDTPPAQLLSDIYLPLV